MKKTLALGLLLSLSAGAILSGCGASDSSESVESDLTDSVTVTVLESSASSGVLRSSIRSTVAATTLEKAADTLLNVPGWSELIADGQRVFSRTARTSDDRSSLTAVGAKRKVRATVSVPSSAGQVDIPVTIDAVRKDNATLTLTLRSAAVSVFFTTVLEEGGIAMNLTLTAVAGGIKIEGDYKVELQAGQENAPKMELLGPLYAWGKPRMKLADFDAGAPVPRVDAGTDARRPVDSGSGARVDSGRDAAVTRVDASPPAPPGPPVCGANNDSLCRCDDGSRGTMLCNPEGDGYSACIGFDTEICDGTTTRTTCSARATAFCRCSDTSAGTKTCNARGTGYGACKNGDGFACD
jgi:hypothetical protein